MSSEEESYSIVSRGRKGNVTAYFTKRHTGVLRASVKAPPKMASDTGTEVCQSRNESAGW